MPAVDPTRLVGSKRCAVSSSTSRLQAASSDRRDQSPAGWFRTNPPVDPLFEPAEAAVPLDDGGRPDAGPPGLAHAAFLVFLRMKSAMR